MGVRSAEGIANPPPLQESSADVVCYCSVSHSVKCHNYLYPGLFVPRPFIPGNWTTRGYANSRTGHLVDWSTRGLDNSRSRRCRHKNEN